MSLQKCSCCNRLIIFPAMLRVHFAPYVQRNTEALMPLQDMFLPRGSHHGWSLIFLKSAFHLQGWSCWDQLSLLHQDAVVLWLPRLWESSNQDLNLSYLKLEVLVEEFPLPPHSHCFLSTCSLHFFLFVHFPVPFFFYFCSFISPHLCCCSPLPAFPP